MAVLHCNIDGLLVATRYTTLEWMKLLEVMMKLDTWRCSSLPSIKYPNSCNEKLHK
jgi:hypothetical protein